MTESKVKKGAASEAIVKARAFLEDINVYEETNADSLVDFIFEYNYNLFKCQVKSFYKPKGENKRVSVRNLGHNKTSHKVSYYSEDDIDLFIAVDLDTFDIYILPSSFIQTYKSGITITTVDKPEYKNNFSLIKEPTVGDDSSGLSQIGETSDESRGNAELDSVESSVETVRRAS